MLLYLYFISNQLSALWVIVLLFVSDWAVWKLTWKLQSINEISWHTILKPKNYWKWMKYQWKFDGNVATFIALQTMWRTPPSTWTYGRMLYKPPTSALESSWEVSDFLFQVFCCWKFVKNNLKVELSIHNSCYWITEKCIGSQHTRQNNVKTQRIYTDISLSILTKFHDLWRQI